jgi:hypothetical protein
MKYKREERTWNECSYVYVCMSERLLLLEVGSCTFLPHMHTNAYAYYARVEEERTPSPLLLSIGKKVFGEDRPCFIHGWLRERNTHYSIVSIHPKLRNPHSPTSLIPTLT